MPKEYDAETKAKAVRLVQDHREDYASESMRRSGPLRVGWG